MVACAALLGSTAPVPAKAYVLVEGGALTAAKMVAAVSQECELKEIIMHTPTSYTAVLCPLQLPLSWCT